MNQYSKKSWLGLFLVSWVALVALPSFAEESAAEKIEVYPPATEPPPLSSSPRSLSPTKVATPSAPKETDKKKGYFGEKFEGIRFGGSGGVEFFKSWLRQNYGGQSVLFSPWAGIGLRLNGRFTIVELIFLEYQAMAGISVSVFEPNFGDGDVVTATKSVYQISPFGGALGVHIPFVPIDVYAGLGWNWYGLLAGTNLDLRGSDLRVGVRFKISKKRMGPGPAVWVEYRNMLTQTDDAGSLPSGLSYEYQTVKLGIGMVF